jgi:hypothetical protein
MSVMTIGIIIAAALLLGSVAGLVAASLGRVARAADEADIAAWARRGAGLRVTGGES